jgi:hypothetical protein
MRRSPAVPPRATDALPAADPRADVPQIAQSSHKYDGLWNRMAADMGQDFHTVKVAMNRIGKRGR